MRAPETVIELTETSRVAAYVDDYPIDGPFDWGTLFVQTLRHANGMAELTSDDGHREPIKEILHNNPFTSFDGYSREQLDKRNEWERDAITKHLTRAGLECRFVELRGYSQGEWLDGVIYASPDYIGDWAGIIAEVQAWYRGDVYTIALEELITYKAANGNLITQWESVDAIGGCILTEQLTLDNVKNYLSIPATVAA
jgi:hypothetical protein